MSFHHIGIATYDLSNAIRVYQKLDFKLKDNELFVDLIQNVQLGFMEKKDNPLIELVAPYGLDSPISKILKNTGSTPYHTCYQVVNIELSIKDLRKQHFIQLINPTPAVAFNGRLICFLYHKTIGLLELLQ